MGCDLIKWAGKGDELTNMDGLKFHVGGCLPDQGRLNEVFAGQWFRLPIKRNVKPRVRSPAEFNPVGSTLVFPYKSPKLLKHQRIGTTTVPGSPGQGCIEQSGER